LKQKNPKRAKGFKEEFNVGQRSSAIFAVPNMKAFIAKCRKLKVKIVVEPVQQLWGGWNAVIADPDGNEFIIDQD
jgi:predicted enzyme related to lactoylglutathione lyase